MAEANNNKNSALRKVQAALHVNRARPPPTFNRSAPMGNKQWLIDAGPGTLHSLAKAGNREDMSFKKTIEGPAACKYSEYYYVRQDTHVF